MIIDLNNFRVSEIACIAVHCKNYAMRTKWRGSLRALLVCMDVAQPRLLVHSIKSKKNVCIHFLEHKVTNYVFIIVLILIRVWHINNNIIECMFIQICCLKPPSAFILNEIVFKWPKVFIIYTSIQWFYIIWMWRSEKSSIRPCDLLKMCIFS